MAHSIEDIPPYLRSPDQKSAFLDWLSLMPIPNNAKRSLIARWRRHTLRNDFTPDDYRTALTPTPESDYLHG